MKGEHADVVMVDEMRTYPTRIKLFQSGSCHLTIGYGLGDVELLHAFALRIGMRREWFQPKSSPHYDLTRARRIAAIKMGALFVPGKEQARERVAARRAR